MALLQGNHEATLVPPLKLARRDAGQPHDVFGGEPRLHPCPRTRETFSPENV